MSISDNNVKNNLCKFLIALFAILIFISFCVFSSTKRDYISAKADVAKREISAIQSNIWNLHPDVNTSELDKVVLKRNICIGTIVVSTIGIIVCCIVLFSKSKETVYTQPVNPDNSTQSKLQELEQIYKSNLITEEEYNSKRQGLLSKM